MAPTGVSTRQFLSLGIGVIFLVTAANFVHQHRDAIAYAWAPVDDAELVGDVTTFTPDRLAHNAYVQLHGITEHRGLHQTAWRGKGWQRQDLWYFRLLGSRGIFVEVVGDANRYGPTQELTVRGRVVDPERDESYAKLLSIYDQTFAAQASNVRRVVQVDVRPGEGRTPYGLVIGLLVLVAVADLVVGVQLLRPYIKRGFAASP